MIWVLDILIWLFEMGLENGFETSRISIFFVLELLTFDLRFGDE